MEFDGGLLEILLLNCLVVLVVSTIPQASFLACLVGRLGPAHDVSCGRRHYSSLPLFLLLVDQLESSDEQVYQLLVVSARVVGFAGPLLLPGYSLSVK